MGTQQVSSNITDVQRGASETGSASSQVLSAAQSLSGDSNRLKLEVGKFLGLGAGGVISHCPWAFEAGSMPASQRPMIRIGNASCRRQPVFRLHKVGRHPWIAKSRLHRGPTNRPARRSSTNFRNREK